MDLFLGQLSNLFISSAALTLIHFVWQGAVVALVLRLLLAIVPQKYFKWRYRLAILALSASIVLPVFTFYHFWESPDLVRSSMIYSSESISKLEALVIGETAVVGAENSLHKGETSSTNAPFGKDGNPLLNVLLVWLMGFLFMAGKFIFELNKTSKLTSVGVLPVSYKISEIAKVYATRYAISRPIQILKSSVVSVPVVVGWLRPVILLPIAITIGLERKQLELIIAHELAHIKRADFLVNILQNIVQICFFYHPSIHWINKIIREEREYICDSMALNLLGNGQNTRLNLAKALLNTEELREGNLSLIAVAASGGKLKDRISHILGAEYRPATSLKSIALGFITLLFCLAAMASTMVDDHSKHKQMIISSTEITVDERTGTIPTNNLRIEAIELAQKSKVNIFEIVPRAKKVDLLNEVVLTESVAIKQTAVKPSLPKVKEKSRQISKRKIAKNKSSRKNSKTLPKQKTVEIPSIKVIESTLIKIKNATEIAEQSINSPNIKNESKTDIIDTSKIVAKTASLDLASAKGPAEPRAIYTPYPEYPKMAWNRMIDITIRVNYTIDKEGYVTNLKTIGERDRDFVREVRRKLKIWRYKPATLDGQPVEHIASLEFAFEAPQKERVILTTTGSRIHR